MFGFCRIVDFIEFLNPIILISFNIYSNPSDGLFNPVITMNISCSWLCMKSVELKYLKKINLHSVCFIFMSFECVNSVKAERSRTKLQSHGCSNLQKVCLRTVCL